MPDKWTDKDERQFLHIRNEQKRRGKPDKRAEEIAARTVNKQRRLEGRTPSRKSQGTGNPNTPLESRTRQELYNRAVQLKIKGRSTMNKRELVDAIKGHQ